MIRLSRGKKVQSNSYGDDNPKKSRLNAKKSGRETNSRQASSSANTRRNHNAPTSEARQEKKSAKSDINTTAFKKSMFWFAFTFLTISCMALLAYGFLSLTNLFIDHPTFTIQHIEISGNERFTDSDILLMSSIEEGKSAFDVNLNNVQSRILQNPWIKNVKITRKLPNTFTIEVEEREPRFFLLYENAIHYVDTEGQIIAPVTQEDFKSFPLLELGASPENALKLLPDFIKYNEDKKLLPFDFSEIAWLRVSAGMGIEMFWEENQMLISIALEDWQENLEYISYAITDLEKRKEFKKVAELHAGNDQVWFVEK